MFLSFFCTCMCLSCVCLWLCAAVCGALRRGVRVWPSLWTLHPRHPPAPAPVCRERRCGSRCARGPHTVCWAGVGARARAGRPLRPHSCTHAPETDTHAHTHDTQYSHSRRPVAATTAIPRSARMKPTRPYALARVGKPVPRSKRALGISRASGLPGPPRLVPASCTSARPRETERGRRNKSSCLLTRSARSCS